MMAADQETGPNPVERSVSIGTWNMDHWKRTPQQRKDAWGYHQTKGKADVMLPQESVAPSDLPHNRFVHREIAGRRPWGSSILQPRQRIVRSPFRAVRVALATAATSEHLESIPAHSWIGCMPRRKLLAGACGCEWITP